MALIYVDATNGNDTTGAGTSGNPYASISKAFTVVAIGDTVKVANTSAQAIGALAMPSITTTTDAWLIIEGWDNGGSATITKPDGNDLTDVGVIEGRFTGTLSFVKFRRLKFSNYNLANQPVYTNISTVIYEECDFEGLTYNGNVCIINSNSTVRFCSFRNLNANLANAVPLQVSNSNSAVYGNFFYNCRKSVVAGGSYLTITDNIFVSAGDYCLSLGAADRAYIANNTFIGDATASSHGITFTNTGMEYCSIFNNHFQDFSGSGSYAINAGAQTWPTTAGTFDLVGRNSFYNNTADYNTGGNFAASIMTDLRSLDISESAEPLEDKANFIYYKKSTATSYGNSSYGDGWNYTATKFNKTTGAAQNEIGAGGGGETSHVSG